MSSLWTLVSPRRALVSFGSWKVWFFVSSHLTTSPGKVQVISTACDPHLGGRDFDMLIFEHLCDQIKTQYKLDVRANRKASIKLRRECARVRIVLSANSVAKYELESFMDGKDVKGQVSRDDLEQWSVPLLDRLGAPIKEALAEAKLEVARREWENRMGSNIYLFLSIEFKFNVNAGFGVVCSGGHRRSHEDALCPESLDSMRRQNTELHM